MRETEENFYIAVSKPYQSYSADYVELMDLTPSGSVFTLDEGSQVFVHPIEQMPQNESSDVSLEEQLSKHVMESLSFIMHPFNQVVVDPNVEKVKDQVTPVPSIRL